MREPGIAEQLIAATADPGDDILGSVARGVSNGTFGLHEGTIILHTLLIGFNMVGWAWRPGEGRIPAPGTQAEFGDLIQAWIESGAQCPAS